MTDAYADHAVPLGLGEAAEVTYHCNTYGKGTDDGGDAHGNGDRRADRPGVPDVAERNHGACFPNGNDAENRKQRQAHFAEKLDRLKSENGGQRHGDTADNCKNHRIDRASVNVLDDRSNRCTEQVCLKCVPTKVGDAENNADDLGTLYTKGAAAGKRSRKMGMLANKSIESADDGDDNRSDYAD